MMMINRQIDEIVMGYEIWLGHYNGEVDMLLGTQKGWLQHVCIDTPVVPYAMCSVDGYIWIGDNTGQLHVYLGTNFGCVGNMRLEPDNRKVLTATASILPPNSGVYFFINSHNEPTQALQLLPSIPGH
jgi:hypothetical protein